MARDESLPRVRATLAGHALTLMLLAGVSVVAVVVLFDWSLKEIVVGAPFGIVIWGAASFFFETRRYVPRGRLPDAPTEQERERPRRGAARRAVWLVISIPLAVGFAWLADAWDLGPVFVPGQWAGYAAAQAIALVLVARWENNHQQLVVLAETHDGDPVLYATTAPQGAR